MSVLELALLDQVTVNLAYTDAQGHHTQREVEPMIFALTSGRWLLVASVALTVPLFAPYVLSRYEQDRLEAEVPLLDVAQMRRNATLRPRDAGRAALPISGTPSSLPLAQSLQQQEPPPPALGC